MFYNQTLGISCPGCAPGDTAGIAHICGVTSWNGPICYTCGVRYIDTHSCYGYSNLPPQQMTARIPHKCPVCEGRGRVAHDFYGETMNNSAQIICQSCHGAGVLWSV